MSSFRSTPSPSLLSLPEELLVLILRHLSLLELSSTLRAVSHATRALIDRNARHLFRHLVIGSRTRPGMKLIDHVRFMSNEDLSNGFARLGPMLPVFDRLTVFDATGFPPVEFLARMTGLAHLSMDTYDFLRLEGPQLSRVTAKLVSLHLAGKFVAFHEARKVLSKVVAVSGLVDFRTDNFLEPHLKLTPTELGKLATLRFLTGLGVIFDTCHNSNNNNHNNTEDVPEQFWDRLERLPSLREFAAGISDLSSPESVAALTRWLPPRCRVLFIQFGSRSNPLMSALHSLRPLVLAVQAQDVEAPDKLLLRELRLDMCGTVAGHETLQGDLKTLMPAVDVLVSPNGDLVELLFFKDKIFE